MVIKTIQELGNAKGVKILHLNVRSVLPKIDQLRALFSDSKLDIVTLSETWLKGHID